MGFLGIFNYEKEGPGVDKDIYETPFKVFFSVFIRKFWKFILINLMQSVCTIPLWILLFVPIAFTPELDTFISFQGQIIVFMIISVIGFPIFSTGLAFILRNFSRQTHAWLWYDFWDKFKSNIKQSIILTLIDIFVIIAAIGNLIFYSQNIIISTAFTLILKSVTAVVFIFYFMMHYYIYTIMVTFELSFKNILKNAFILTFVKLPKNLLTTVLIYVTGFVLFSFGASIGVMVSTVIGCVFANYIAIFNAVPIIDNYLMPIDKE